MIPNLLVGRNAGKGTGREVFLPCWTWISCAFVLFGSRQKAAELSWALKKFCCIFCMEKNCDEDKKGEVAVQREEAEFSWAVPSQWEADRVRQWPLESAQGQQEQLSRNSAPTWKTPPGPAGGAGISSQVVFSQRTLKILNCRPALGIFLKAVSCSLSHQWVFWES